MATVSRLRRSTRRILVTLTIASRILEAKWLACLATPSESFVDLRFVLRNGLRLELVLAFSTFAAPKFCCSLYKAGPLSAGFVSFILFWLCTFIRQPEQYQHLTFCNLPNEIIITTIDKDVDDQLQFYLLQSTQHKQEPHLHASL